MASLPNSSEDLLTASLRALLSSAFSSGCGEREMGVRVWVVGVGCCYVHQCVHHSICNVRTSLSGIDGVQHDMGHGRVIRALVFRNTPLVTYGNKTKTVVFREYKIHYFVLL